MYIIKDETVTIVKDSMIDYHDFWSDIGKFKGLDWELYSYIDSKKIQEENNI